MNQRWLWFLAKGLEGLGLVVILVGVLLSIRLGLHEKDGLASMAYEMRGLGYGGGLFLLGYLIERKIGAR